MNLYLGTIGTALGSILLIALATNELSREHQSDVRVVWYFFFLAVFIALLLTDWARGAGAVDAEGNFHGKAGDVLSFLLTSSLDLKSSLILCAAIVVLVIAPQVFSYIFSGLSGCASAPLFVEGSLTFLVWGLVKSLSVAGGVFLAVPTYAWLDGWKDWSFDRALSMSLFAALLTSLAFCTLFIYRGLVHVPERIVRVCPPCALRRLRIAHRWMSRRIADEHS